MLQGAIFDMDGLLFDSERVWDSLWPVCFQKMGLPLPPDSFYTEGRGMAGKIYAEHVRKYYPDADVPALIRLLLRLGDQRFAQGVPMKKGALELLAYLRAQNIPCVVASSSPRSMIENNLRYAGIASYFYALVSGQDVSRSKPDPEIFLLAASKLQVEISRCVVLEDSPNGVRAGHAAGAITIMVPDLIAPDPQIQKLYTFCCLDLSEVKTLLEQTKR